MKGRQRYQPIVRVRRFLLLALLLFGGGLAGFYLTGRLQHSPEGDGQARHPGGLREVGGDVLTVAEGFDYEVSDGEEVSFRIQAEKLVSDVEDRVVLEQVTLRFPEGDGEVVVEGRTATIHLASQSASIEGDVRARDDEGLELRGAGFEVVREGRALVSRSPVTFALRSEYRGRADALSYQIKKKRLSLEGRVVIQGLPVGDPQAPSLRCDTLLLEREEGLLRLEGDVRLARGEEYLEATRIGVTFAAASSAIHFVRAERQVQGRYMQPASGTDPAARIDFEGRILYALFEEGTDQAKQVELLGRVREEASLSVLDETGLLRLLSAPVLRADLVHGEIRHAEAHEPVVLEERMGHAPAALLRRLCADRIDAELDARGEIESFVLEGTVDYQEPGAQALGDRIVAHRGGDEVVFTGQPATVVDSRGMLQAPEIRRLPDGQVEARQGVRAELAETRGQTLMGASDSEAPVRVTAETAIWKVDPETAVFEGDVRAWQGDDYLLAERMVGEPDRDLLTATGDVKTVSRRPVGDRESSDDEGGPIEITADELIYRRDERLVSYDGGARVRQDRRTMSCERLDVELDADDEFERMICTGELRVEDPAQGKQVTGDRAVYRVEDDTVDVTGSPVVLSDRQGAKIRGGRVLYRFADGGAEILSREPGDEEEPQAADGEGEDGDGDRVDGAADEEPGEDEDAQEPPQDRRDAAGDGTRVRA